MNKNTQIVLIIFTLLIIFIPKISISQIDDANFGKTVKTPTPYYPPGTQLSRDGFHPPLTKKQERAMRKARRLFLSNKQKAVIYRKESGHDSVFWDNFRYPFLKHKQKKLNELLTKSGYKKDSSAGPAYMRKANKYKLTIEEQDLIQRSKDSTQTLTPEEQKKLKKALAKEKKYQKYKQKYTIHKFTKEETDLLRKNPKSLSKEQLKELKKLKKIQKQNERRKNKIHKFKIDSAVQAGGWMPVQEKKFSLKNLFSPRRHSPRPSSYVRKLRRYERRYKLTEKEKQAYNKYKSGAFMKPYERKLANRAWRKMWEKKEKIKKLQHKEYMKMQPPPTRRMIRKTQRQADRKRKRQKNKFLYFISKIFKKR
jgi:hypothetical protein